MHFLFASEPPLSLALSPSERFHFRVFCAGSPDKECHDGEGHEPYELHPGKGLPSGDPRMASLSHSEQLMGAHAHTTTPHLAAAVHAQLSPHQAQYRQLPLPPPPDHEPQSQHYSSGTAESRPTVIESNQPLIIECT